MKEKYYLKSISRTIKKDRVQPLIIIFVLIIAFIVSNISLTLSNAFKNEDLYREKSINGTSDIIISTNSKSGSRFLIKEDIENTLDDVIVNGSFTVPFMKENNLINSIAIDLENANQFFEFNFISYSSFNINEKSNIVFISEKYSKENNIKLNDIISFTLFGKEMNYQVKGINKTKLIGENDVLIDISSFINSLKETSPYLSLFTDDFKIYNKIYIKSQNSNLENIYNILIDKYKEYTIYLVNNDIKRADESISEALSFVMVFLTFITSFSVLLTTTYCINKKRKELSSLFYLVGYTKSKITLYRIYEMLIYTLIGFIIGTPLSVLLSKICFNLIGFNFALYEFKFILSILVLVILSLCSILPILFTITDRNNINKKDVYSRIWLVLPLILILLIPILFLVTGKAKFYIGMSVLFSLFISIFIFTKPLVIKTAKILSSKAKNIYRKIAFKNAMKVYEISNITKLLALLCSLFALSILFIVSSISTYIEKDYYLDADCVIASANSNIYNEIKNLDGIESITGFYLNEKYSYNNRSVILWGAENDSFYGPMTTYDSIPHENELYTSVPYATKYGIRVGDTISLKINNEYKDFYVKGVHKGVEYNFLIDPSYFGDSFNYYFVTFKDGCNNDNLYNNVSSIVSSEMGVLVESNTILKSVYERQIMYITFVSIISLIIVVFGIIGIYNNVSENNRSRKEEIEYYSLSGMSKTEIKLVKKYENRFTIIFSLIFTAIVTILLIIASNQALLSYAADLIETIKALFRI